MKFTDNTTLSGWPIVLKSAAGCSLQILSGRVFMLDTRAQRKLLHTWIVLVIWQQCLVQIDRIDGPTKDVDITTPGPRQRLPRPAVHILSHMIYLFVSFKKSTPPQNRQLIVYYDYLKYQVRGFVGVLTFWYWAALAEACRPDLVSHKVYLTWFCKSQIRHKFVKLFFILGDSKEWVVVLGGGLTLEKRLLGASPRQRLPRPAVQIVSHVCIH